MKPLLAILALVLPVQAQPRNVEISFYCLKYAPGVETVHVPKQGGFEAVRLSTANMTVPVTATFEGTEAVIHRSLPSAGAPVQPAGKMQIPANINKALVVLVPNAPGAGEPYHTLVIDQGESFRMGSYRVVNFSRRAIRGAIGRSYIEAASGKIADLQLEGEPGAVQGVRFEFQDEGRWNRLTETRCAVRKDRRWLLCVYQEPGTGRMNMRSIPDRTRLLVTHNADNELSAAPN